MCTKRLFYGKNNIDFFNEHRWFFHKNGLQKIADEGATDAVVTKVTKRTK